MNTPGPATRTKDSAAFTLLELIVVVTIIGILSSIVVVRTRHFPERARAAKIKADLTAIVDAADMIYALAGRFPETIRSMVDYRDAEGRLIGGLESYPHDPWNNDYGFEVDDDGARAICLGSDGTEGGEGEAADTIHPSRR